MFVRAAARFFNIKQIENVSYRCLSRSYSTYEERKRNFSKENFYGNILVATSVFGYVTWKERLSASDIELAGHREKHNFITDVVVASMPSVVLIEKQHESVVDLLGKPIVVSEASGLIVKKDGLIVTNAHVVINMPNTKIVVRLMDGSTYIAEVEDVDLVSDLATLRIPVEDLPTTKLGSSSDVKLGEWVVSIGSPLALDYSVSTGVVSYPRRAGKDLGLRNDITYIQTDAYVTFGNSGGPLVNLDGEVIGINSFKITTGISFAIPIDHVKDFLAKRKSHYSLEFNKCLGISMLSLTKKEVMLLNMWNPVPMPNDIEDGVLVWKVVKGSPAYKSGLQSGDIIFAINGIKIHRASDVNKAVEKTKGLMLMEIVRGSIKMAVILLPANV